MVDESAILKDEKSRYRYIQRVTLLGSVADFLLGVGKIWIGFVGQSQALIADGIHSLSDLLTDFMVLFAAKHGSRDADEDHPYGHGRIETVMTVGLGLALIVVALGIAYDAVTRLFEPELLMHPGMMALVVAALSIVSKELIYHYTMHAARLLRSNLLRANAWHSRSDAISSVVVLIGVLGSMAGLDYLDAIAAVGVAYMITKIGWDLAWHSIRELVDTALEPERVEEIRNLIQSVDGVEALHLLRTRRMGADALVDVHIQVDSRVSVSEGHQISETVRNKLIKEIEEVSDVMVHIDPEDDETQTPCCHLPLRREVEKRLRASWAGIPEVNQLEQLTLHYLDGKLEVAVTLPLSLAGDLDRAQHLSESMRSAALQQFPGLRSVQVRFSA